MKNRITTSIILTLAILTGAANAATITVNTADNTDFSAGKTNLVTALLAANDGDTVAFNIPGAGPHYLLTPVGGYPRITKNRLTINGYSQPGSVPNTNPILASNNAQIKIVLTSTNGNYTDMAYEPSNPNAGFGPGEVAILGILDATNVTVRGLCLLGDRLEGHYAIAVARNYAGGAVGLGNGLHLNGCWIGLDVDGTPGYGFADGIAAFRHADNVIGNAARLPSNNHVIGVKPGSLNPRSEFNIILGCTINIIMEGQAHRVSGNFLGVLPSGTNDYIVPFAEPGRFAESHIEIGRGASDVVIGTDGDGVNDADERNVMTGVMTDGNNNSGSFSLGGYRHVIELYSLSSSPGEDRQRVRISGNYIGVGVDGVTRFTNGVPMLNGSSTAGSHYWIGSDFDGVSDSVEGNVFYGNYPPGLFYTTAYTNSTSSGSGSHGFMDEPDPNAGGFSARGNTIVNNYPFPFNPRRGENPANPPAFTGLRTYINKALVTPQPATEEGYYGLLPVISASSTTARLIGTAPANNATYPYLIIDLYLPDPEGLTNGLVVLDPYLTNGWVHGKTFLCALLDNGPLDTDPAAGSFNFAISSLGLAAGTKVTISANYSKDAPGTHNARVLTSLFSNPQTLAAGGPVVTVVDDGVSNVGAAGTLYWALTNASADQIISFNVPGAGPHYFKAPPKGFPLIYQKHGLTIDGYTQPGSAVNTAPITATNNAVIKIVIDSRNNNFRDMAYVWYGSIPGVTDSDPPINNAPMYGDGGTTSTGHEREGYSPAGGFNPADPVNTYRPGEVSAMGVYRSRNVTIKGLAFIGSRPGNGAYLLSVAQDFGLDTAVKDRFSYDNGTCRGFHLAGCWFGIDPGTGAEAGSDAALTAFRHRDRGGLAASARRPAVASDPNDEGVPNGEGHCIGPKPDCANPRAEFNVFADCATGIAAEYARIRISGNQFLSSLGIATDIGRYSDTKVPSVLVGTDGDGVNDADEGNLFLKTPDWYNTQTKVQVFAGNVFNLERDGSRPGTGFGFAFNQMRLDQGAVVRFGSDFNGVSDALEANKVYDAGFGVNFGGGAPANGSALSMRGNVLVNCATPPIPGTALTYFDKFMDATAAGTAKPVISPVSTVSVLNGTCTSNKPPYTRVYIDLYIADPEGDTAGDPQGKTYLATFEDNSPADGNPAVGAFSFNISSLAIASGTKVTLAATYSNESKPSLSLIGVASPDVTVGIAGGNPPYDILRASPITGAWTTVMRAKLAGNVTVPAAGDAAFYRATGVSAAQQTSPFADSVALNP
jgi:hypothetical protein